MPFAKRWSRSSRDNGRDAKYREDKHRQRIIEDATALVATNPDIDYMIEGHHHLALDTALPSTGTRLVVLGDWIDLDTYAEFDGTNLELKRYK